MFGADSVLLIVRILSQEELFRLLSFPDHLAWSHWSKFQMKQIFTKRWQPIAKLLALTIVIFLIFLSISGGRFVLARRIPKGRRVLSLSGFSGSDVRLVRSVVNGILVGSHLIRSAQEDVEQDFSEALKQKTQTLVNPVRS